MTKNKEVGQKEGCLPVVPYPHARSRFLFVPAGSRGQQKPRSRPSSSNFRFVVFSFFTRLSLVVLVFVSSARSTVSWLCSVVLPSFSLLEREFHLPSSAFHASSLAFTFHVPPFRPKPFKPHSPTGNVVRKLRRPTDKPLLSILAVSQVHLRLSSCPSILQPPCVSGRL